ncbi:unnamed protein product [marine sediment metagenome]|uniref:Uncharacterized protein n=1 Tax=marine sediment metagenome TaxID=412755 RepID=X1CIL1_9ZZZZ
MNFPIDEAIKSNLRRKRLELLEAKLKAVRTHLTKWVSEHSDWQMGRMSQWKKELDEILEAEGQ